MNSLQTYDPDDIVNDTSKVVTSTWSNNVNNLTTEIARALNDATPCNAWRGWGCGATGTTFEITFTTVSSPGLGSISLLSNSSFFETFGFNVFTYTPPATVGGILFSGSEFYAGL